MGESAFYGCINLKSAEIGNGVTELSTTFVCCYNLTDVKMSGSIESTDNAFLGCVSLKEIEIPYGTKSFDESYNYGVFPQKLTVSETVSEFYFQSPFLTDIVIYGDDVPNSFVGYSYYEPNVTYDEFCELVKNYEYYSILYEMNGTDEYEEKAEEAAEQLNSAVTFYNDPVPVKKLKIHGYENSLVQQFAEDNGFEFVPLQKSVSGSGITVSFETPPADEVSIFAEKYTARAPEAGSYTIAGADQKALCRMTVVGSDGKIIQPKEGQKFSVSVPCAFSDGAASYPDGAKLNIFHIKADGKTASVVTGTVSGGKVVFEIDGQ